MLLRLKIKPPVQRPHAVKKTVPAALKSGRFPLCLISQPVGSGKTDFISRFAGECGHVLWYSLDSMDNQERIFLENLEFLFSQATGQNTPQDMTVQREPEYRLPPERADGSAGRRRGTVLPGVRLL